MISYVVGDATQPLGRGNKVIAHVCNDVGGWGRGFVLSLSARWPQPERNYRSWFRQQSDSDRYPPLALGQAMFVKVEEDVYVANMVAQHDVAPTDAGPPIRYEALEQCLEQVREFARDINASVHMPRIGCGLAGGEWARVEEIVERVLSDVEVYVYDLEPNGPRSNGWKR